MESYTYLALMLATFGFPLLLSFDRKVAYYKEFLYLLPGMLLTATVFIVWDVWFTDLGVWSFNPDYLVGINILNLPLEEWMFFFAVPYACVFIYACLNAYFPTERLETFPTQMIAFGLALLLFILASFAPDQLYTLVTFYGLAVCLMLVASSFPDFLGRFFAAYLVSLIPFFFVNGVLTAWPVVIYNDVENFGIRLGTIPIEDTAYSMLLLLMNIGLYEWFRQRAFQAVPQMKKQYE